jgi:hypothetical protein
MESMADGFTGILSAEIFWQKADGGTILQCAQGWVRLPEVKDGARVAAGSRSIPP